MCDRIGVMYRTPYLTDLRDAEWDCIASLFPAPARQGRPRLHGSREILNAILSVLRSGCAWRLRRSDGPPRSSSILQDPAMCGFPKGRSLIGTRLWRNCHLLASMSYLAYGSWNE